MLDFYGVLHAPTGKLKDAINGLSDTISELVGIKHDVKGQVTEPVTASGWSGEAATAGIALMRRVTAEVGDAIAEAKGIKTILSDAHTILQKAKRDLQEIVDREAPEQGFSVNAGGSVFVTTGPGDRGREGPSDDQRAKLTALQQRIDKIVTTASAADDDAAWALRANVRGDAYDFTAPKHDSLKEADNARDTARARKAVRLAEESLRLASEGKFLSDEKLVSLQRLLKENAKSPAFATAFYTSLGPENALRLQGQLSLENGTPSLSPDKERRGHARDIQRQLGVALAAATASGSDTHLPDAWTEKIKKFGRSHVDLHMGSTSSLSDTNCLPRFCVTDPTTRSSSTASART